MATRNIQMNYYNGSSYDQLYPQANLSNVTGSLSLDKTSGTLAISRGGTGQTTATNAMYSLISGMSTTTSVAINDYIPIQDVSVSGGRKVLVSNFISTIQNNGFFKITPVKSYNLNLAERAETNLSFIAGDFFDYFLWYIKILPKNANISGMLQLTSSPDRNEKIPINSENLYSAVDDGVYNMALPGGVNYLQISEYYMDSTLILKNYGVTMTKIEFYGITINI